MRVLALALVVATGCGRLGFDSERAQGADAGPMVEVAPRVCETLRWPTVPFATTDIDLAAVPTPAGVALLWVPTAGGQTLGATIGTDWQLGAGAGALVKDGGWSSIAAAYVDDMLVFAVASTDVKLDVVGTDLTGDSELTCPIGTHVGGPPLIHAGPDRVFPITRDNGLSVIPVDATLTAHGSMIDVATNPSVGMAAAPVGTTAAIAWSTTDTCYVEQVMDMATGAMQQQSPVPCASPSLASDGTSGVLVFESAAGVSMVRGAPSALDASLATVLAAGATAPRVAFDGQHFWISYRDASGMLETGYLASDGRFLTTTTTSSAAHDANDLVIVQGEPWLFSVDTDGLQTRRLCIQP